MPLLKAGRVIDAGMAPSAIRYDGPVTVPAGATVKARALWADQWSTLRETTSPPEIFPLRIAEVMYNPPPLSQAERDAGFTDKDEFEFIELVNVSDASIDLTDVRFVQTDQEGQVEGLAFDFAGGSILRLDPGARLLVVEDLDAFRTRYGSDLPVAGVWSGGLSNDSEQITLVAGTETIHQFRYQDDWHPSSDGEGRSLEILSEASNELTLWAEARGWLASIADGGTPGLARSSAPVTPGDLNLDGLVDPSDREALALALSDPAGYAARYGLSAIQAGDVDSDADLDYDDIAGFVALLPPAGAATAATAPADALPAAAARRSAKQAALDQNAPWQAQVDRQFESLGRRSWK
jgi:hypothetical protein